MEFDQSIEERVAALRRRVNAVQPLVQLSQQFGQQADQFEPVGGVLLGLDAPGQVAHDVARRFPLGVVAASP